MKTIPSISIILAFLLVLIPLMVKSQSSNTLISYDETQVELTRNINLENDSKNENVTIVVNEASVRLELIIFANLNKGSVDIEIYSPSGQKESNITVGSPRGVHPRWWRTFLGQKEWNITVGSQTASYKEEIVNGTIKKILTEPDSGEWIIKLNPENASGSISINSKTVEN